jgi:hypothetical protein
VLENLGANFESVHLGAVLKQSLASKISYLLKAHMLNTISELFINYPEIFRKQLVTLVSVMKPSQYVLKVKQEMRLEDAHGLLRAENLVSDTVQCESCKFDLIKR